MSTLELWAMVIAELNCPVGSVKKGRVADPLDTINRRIENNPDIEYLNRIANALGLTSGGMQNFLSLLEMGARWTR